MTKTRQTDRNGNVFYAVTDEAGQQIATIDKTCGGWQLTYPDGTYVPRVTVARAMQIIAAR